MKNARIRVALVMALAAGGCVGPEIEIRSDFEIFVAGENEVCGDTRGCGSEGFGQISVQIDDEAGELCYDLELTDIPDSTAAHVHSGGLQDVGDIVIDLGWEKGAVEGGKCFEGLDPELLKEIRENPRLYYVNVHSEDFPDGAARGQFQT